MHCTNLGKWCGNLTMEQLQSFWNKSLVFFLLRKNMVEWHRWTLYGSYAAMNKGDQAIPMRNLTSPFCLFHGILRESTEEGSTSSNRKENRNTFCWVIATRWAKSWCNPSFITGRSLVITDTPLISIALVKNCWFLRPNPVCTNHIAVF